MGTAYSREAVKILNQKGKVWFVKIGTPYPIPEGKLLPVLQECKKILVVEDGDPIMETQLRVLAQQNNLPVQFFGKVGDGVFRLHGELNTDKVVKAMSGVLDITLPDLDARNSIKEEH